MIDNPMLLPWHAHTNNQELRIPILNFGQDHLSFFRSRIPIEETMSGCNLQSRVITAQDIGTPLCNTRSRAKIEDPPTVLRGRACQWTHPIDKCNPVFST